MSEFNYDTYCGIYCGACSIITAYNTGQKDKLAAYWTESTLKTFLQTRGIPIEGEDFRLKCHGCKSDNLFVNCKHCKIRECAIDRKIDHCIDCSDYPCKLFDEGIFNQNILKVLPHLKSAPDNLLGIKKAGVADWLAEQDQQWKCPDCQTKFSWYTTNCSKCGRELEEFKDFNKK